jgi:OOP family OmpA-OmpF porin
MKKVLTLLLLCATMAQAQDEQVLYKLVQLGRNVNSRYHESAPLVTPDNQRLYFTVSNHPENNDGVDNSQDIWYSDKQPDGSWGDAIHMESPVNNRKFNQVLTILDGGNTLLIRGGNRKKEEGFSLIYKDGDKWKGPDELEIEGFEEMNNGRFSGAAISQDRSAIVIYMNERTAKPYSDLYVSKRIEEGKYSRPKKIEALSTYKDEFGPYLAENDQVMYYASNREGSMGGVDVWKVRRLDDSWHKWSEPQNIGAPINTGGFDSYFSVDSSGQNAFTTRTYVSADGSNMNIYGLVPKAKITVKGQVLDAETKEPLDILLGISAQEEKNKSIQTGASGEYSFTTYQEKTYQFGGTKIGYEQLTDAIDLTAGFDKDTVITKDIYLQPVKAELVLYGYITEAETLVPANAYLKVIKGGFKDSVQTAYQDGGYKLKLADKGNYLIQVISKDYELVQDTLNAQVEEGTYFKEFRKDYQLKKIVRPYKISGYVYDEKTQEPLSVKLNFDVGDSTIFNVTSKADGYYEALVKVPDTITIRGQKQNYLNLEDKIMISDDQRFLEYNKDLYISPIEVGKTVIINNIYFNFDKTSLKEESFPELNRLTELMQQNPGIKIEIGGHTDDKGSDDYNLTLSEGRAQSVKDYLIEKGIAADRMTAKGYGETEPISSNATDQGRAENRRVEFTILAVE